MSTAKAPIGAVFIDLDETLYPGSTIKDTGRWLLERGELARSTYIKIIWWLILRQLGLLNHEAAFSQGVRVLTGRDRLELDRLIRAAYAAVLRPKISESVWKLARSWRKYGPIVLATESLRIIATPFAEDLGATAVLATDFEVNNKILTGRLSGPVLRDQAKNLAVSQWASQEGIDLAHSWAVGARPEDALLLGLVGHGRMLNPNAAATHLAMAHGWEIIRT